MQKKLKAQGLYFLGERELLDYVELCILKSRPQEPDTAQDANAPWTSSGHLIMGLASEVHLDDPSCQTSWRRDRRMGTYHNIATDASTGDSSANSNALKIFLSRCANSPTMLEEKDSAEYLAYEICMKVFKFMLKPEEEEVDIKLSLTQIGLDSLMAIELRRWWKQAFGLDISVLEIMGCGTLEELGEIAAAGLRKKLAGEVAPAT